MSRKLNRVDWEEQWRLFAPGFREGLAHIDLNSFGGPDKVLRLAPGGGFGDLSHPTTRLMLRLMAPLASGHYVVDIGCGSGILTLAAILMGAPSALGIDIEKEALKHARNNAKLNGLEKYVRFSQRAGKCGKPLLVLMNMIFYEQQVAWSQQVALHATPKLIITSGILTSQRKQYLAQAKLWGWKLLKERREKGWLGFLFSSEKLFCFPVAGCPSLTNLL